MKNYLLILLTLVISCRENNVENKNIQTKNLIINDYEAEYNNKENLNKLLKDAIDNYNKDSYFEAFRIHVISNRYEEFLYYSIMMAEKNNFDQAYYDCYYLMTVRINKPNKLAMYYLLKAYEKGNEDAKDEIKELFPDTKTIPTSNSFLCNS